MVEKEPTLVRKRVDYIGEIRDGIPSVGVHPYTFNFLSFTFKQSNEVTLSEVQKELFYKYYTQGLVLTDLESVQRDFFMGLIRNGFANLYAQLSETDKKRYPENKIPLFKEQDIHLGTKDEQKVLSRAKKSIFHLGIKRSEETKQKISIAKKGKKHSLNSRKKMS